MRTYKSKFAFKNGSIKFYFLCNILIIFISSVKAQTPTGFNLVAYEGFNYTSGSSLLNANNGTGWTSAWSRAYQDKYFKTSNTGFTYAGLSTEGLKAEFDGTCYGTCNDIAGLGRSLPLQNNGVVYFQFISVFEASGGAGTPNIRLFSKGTLTGGIGASSGSFMSILDASLSNTATSTASLSAQNLVVIRVDYNLNKTEMWINPNLSTFDYSNPISPSASALGFSPSFDRIDIFIRSGSIDEISVFSAISPPTSITGSNTICAGNSTTLTSSGGTSGSNVIDVWYSGVFDEAFSQGWETQPYTTNTSTVNSNSNGILNVTSTGGDPQITMDGLGSFNPSVYKYINFRYRVVSGTAGSAVIYFLNSAIVGAEAGYALSTSLISDNNWHVATLNMSAHTRWTDSYITGWRFDYASTANVTMDIDFIQLGSTPIIGTGTSISVAPTVSTTYSVNRKGPSVNTTAISQLITVNALPIPNFTAQPDNTVIDTDVSYTTQSGQSNYVWTIPGILNTDYSISSGGTSTDNSIVLKWLKNGSKAVQINYTNSNNCVGATATSSNSINARNSGITKNGLKISNPANSINQYGIIGIGKSVSIYGEIMDTPLPPIFSCPSTLTISHITGALAPATVTITYGVVSTSLSGSNKCWITQNLGATVQAASATDNTVAAAGWYWQFNRKQGYAVGPTPVWTITNINENSDWLAANDPCTIELGTGWRIPTKTEWTDADRPWASYTDTYNSVLKLHAAGYLRDSSGTLLGRGASGNYWGSTQNSSTTVSMLYFSSGLSSMYGSTKAYGFSIRCLRD